MSASEQPKELLTPPQQIEALSLVRSAVEIWVANEVRITPPASSSLNRIQIAAFVTLTLQGRLRGCIGSLGPREPLGATLVDCAISAACRDSRFSPVTKAELAQACFEVSTLTPLRLVAGPQHIVVGRDGVLVEIGGRRGLLLPQVATRYGWDRETFLDHACVKAGFEAGDWRRGARLWTFQAQVFSEADPAA
ncbi:MAG: AmmeMemoRadiSam system protein A [Acidobacteria bacterium]|nr:AmmeMemoRadiSam system protein A [Acidobacteriota bacterium]